MLKGNRKYIFILSIFFIVLVSLQVTAPKPVNWQLSYKKDDKIPYGVSALYAAMPFLFPSVKTFVKDVPLYNGLKNTSHQHTCYMIINHSFEADKLDVKELLNFVKQGNSAFISAGSFADPFMDSLKLKTTAYFDAPLTDSAFTAKNPGDFSDDVHLNFYNSSIKHAHGYSIRNLTGTFFSSFDTAAVTVIGYMEQHQVNFIKMRYGNGTFYLHTTPEVFTNYNFLSKDNSDYVAGVFSYFTPEILLWDEYYKEGRTVNKSTMRVIMNHPSLTMAYYVVIFSILVFMLIGIKRKQRIIPVIEPQKNTTLEFVNTIGALYYQHGSHKAIAERQISYFLSHLKSILRLSTTDYDQAFIIRIASLSGIEYNKVEGVMKYISYIKSKSRIHEQELLQLNKMIEDFYKSSKR